MVAGAVTPPRIDLTNEELMRAHIHAIWLTESKMSLGRSLKDILDLSGDSPTLELLDSVKSSINNKSYRQRTKERAERILEGVSNELKNADWYHERWLDEVLDRILSSFEQACDRWRGLYRSALSQAKAQTEIILNASRSQSDKNEAKRLRQEAESQLRLLTEIDDLSQSDFYSYRYFASEGFLPGYNFPRLPLSAYIPGRKSKRDDMISRPRFLAITEFGPRSVIYHEGSRYSINKAILPVTEAEVATQKVKLCEKCGYLHPITEGDGLDLCMNCKNPLGLPIQPLFRLQNVATQRRDRINCDEEERLRFGYEIMTGVRFAEHADRPSSHTATLEYEGKTLAQLTYGQAANIWRINLGWTRRKNKDQYGFMLDMERGYWQKNENAGDEEPDDPMSQRIKRVIPYVEDHKNCLIFKPTEPLDKVTMATLESALKNAIQTQFQLEDNEIAAEPLPSSDERNMILFYESAEGGAGVLRQLLEDKNAFQSLAVEALKLCHFDPQGEDLRHAPRSREDCEAACYDCLMNYTNQRVHPLLDRKSIRGILIQWTHSNLSLSPGEKPRSEHLTGLMNLAQSDLERKWLVYMEEHDYRLPARAQAYIEACKTRPDFFYEDQQTAIYVDGPYHDFPTGKSVTPIRRNVWKTKVILSYALDMRMIGAKLSPGIHTYSENNSKIGEGAMNYTVGSLVKARGREWVVLPESEDDLLVLRPLGGTDDEVTGIYLQLENIEPASFDLPDPTQMGGYRSCRLLRDAIRLGFRSSAGPFRSFARIAVEPRPYQLVPLLMALKQDPIRILIADDVGIGKTIEACLIARELIDRGETQRLAVLCPPQLAEQWQSELLSKFHIDAELVLPGTATRLERNCGLGQSLFDLYPYIVVSMDFIKSDRRRDEFLRTCPELVIVDEAHTCSESNERGGRHQRHQLIAGLASDRQRGLILVTATPHSGKEDAFRSLLALLNPDFAHLPTDLTGRENEHHRRRLAEHFVQRRRGDIRLYMDTETPFPERDDS